MTSCRLGYTQSTQDQVSSRQTALTSATDTMQVLCNHIDRLFEGTCDMPQLLAPTTFAGAHLTRMQPQARAKCLKKQRLLTAPLV